MLSVSMINGLIEWPGNKTISGGDGLGSGPSTEDSLSASALRDSHQYTPSQLRGRIGSKGDMESIGLASTRAGAIARNSMGLPVERSDLGSPFDWRQQCILLG